MTRADELVALLSHISGPGWSWYAKILSANDTLANAAHQAGPYIPKAVFFRVLPGIEGSRDLNPRTQLPVRIESHGIETAVTAIWYNNRVVQAKTRNEARITGWGGRESPLLDPEATGSLCLFAFHQEPDRNADRCIIWLCSDRDEEDALEAVVGQVEPGRTVFRDASGHQLELLESGRADSACRLSVDQLPREWLTAFPEAEAIVRRSVENLRSARKLPVDKRLLLRRDCEFELFKSVEEAVVLPRIREGFGTVDLFVGFANSVTNRRKSRGGASLELQARTIFEEENVAHAHNVISEGNKRPDFLFPSADAYHNKHFPVEKLAMLAAKTTCKDRWRQILNEADRLPTKYLLTLQRGVSENQFAEMKLAGVRLVVPLAYHDSFPESIRGELISVEAFLASVRN